MHQYRRQQKLQMLNSTIENGQKQRRQQQQTIFSVEPANTEQ